MIDAILTGRLAIDPTPGTSRNGNPYATARIQATTNAEDRLTISVITFDTDTMAGLLALTTGDAVTLAGELTPKVWTDTDSNAHPSADLKAYKLLTAYHVTRKRKAMEGDA